MYFRIFLFGKFQMNCVHWAKSAWRNEKVSIESWVASRIFQLGHQQNIYLMGIAQIWDIWRNTKKRMMMTTTKMCPHQRNIFCISDVDFRKQQINTATNTNTFTFQAQTKKNSLSLSLSTNIYTHTHSWQFNFCHSNHYDYCVSIYQWCFQFLIEKKQSYIFSHIYTHTRTHKWNTSPILILN